MVTIDTENLVVHDLPKERASWSSVADFASTYALDKEKATGRCPSGVGDVDSSASIQELRIALYSEWRRWNHFNQEPDTPTMKEIWDVIELIRGKL